MNELALLRLGYGNACRERDALAQRCRELESDLRTLGDGLRQAALMGSEAERERDTLRTENVRLAEWYSEAGVREDAQRAENERLRNALERIHRRTEAFISDGSDMRIHSVEAINEIARKALEAGT